MASNTPTNGKVAYFQQHRVATVKVSLGTRSMTGSFTTAYSHLHQGDCTNSGAWRTLSREGCAIGQPSLRIISASIFINNVKGIKIRYARRGTGSPKWKNWEENLAYASFRTGVRQLSRESEWSNKNSSWWPIRSRKYWIWTKLTYRTCIGCKQKAKS